MFSKAVVGGGCFWCVETLLRRLKGVHKVQSGYAGGHVQNPTYKDVCSGNTGHTQVCQVTYDSNIINYYSKFLFIKTFFISLCTFMIQLPLINKEMTQALNIDPQSTMRKEISNSKKPLKKCSKIQLLNKNIMDFLIKQ